MDRKLEMMCSICVRGGSKGVKNKNLREVNGLPLLIHSLEHAKKSQLFSCIAVSSDSLELLNLAEKWGADVIVKRPDEMATDTAAKLPVIQHCARQAELKLNKKFDVYVDLDATSPLRLPEDIIGSVELLIKKNASNIITGSPSRRSPYFNLVEENKLTGCVGLAKKLEIPVVRRQDAPKTYDMNASIYVWWRESLFNSNSVFGEKTMLFEMPDERSMDIDNEFDFKIVKFLMERNHE